MNTKTVFFTLLTLAASSGVLASASVPGVGLQHRGGHHNNLMSKHAGHALAAVRHRRRAGPGKKTRCAARKNTLTSTSTSTSTPTATSKTMSSTEKEDPTPTPTSTPPPPPPPPPSPKTTTTTKKQPSTTKEKPSRSTPTPTQDNGNNGGGNGNNGGGGGNNHSGDGTFYTPGLNACGTTDNQDSMIAAISYKLWDSWPRKDKNPNNHPLCNKVITAHYQGKKTTVRITDRCAGCEIFGSLDFSPNAFAQLADPDVGRIRGVTWSL